ncbi:Hypothetical predicted protein [Mytilus galloprovincialis]|uniref:Uncharacterized protein n=1 Tax=Mytilus galloprovincialis TaxID=29158 RepID=A0A8B6G4D9_MYTGA|nr:Hypothetical predicted protein [Mytilus galloprovincialis]
MNHFVCRVFGILIVLVIYTALSVEGADVAYDASCAAADAVCNEANNVCDSGTNKCACSTDSFRNNGGTACVTKIAYDAVCDAADSGQCADTNAECKDDGSGTNKCLCQATHYDSSNVCTLIVGLDGDCDISNTDAEQCSVANTECKSDGAGNNKCLCEATHYSDSSACQLRKKPEETCSTGHCVEHATCDTVSPTKCECDAGYTATPTTSPTMCSGVVKFASLSYMYVVPILVSMMSLLR